ncbi:MAG: bifunctional acetate--CoA ligase family protein/GNAT family N-acetyltransferase [Alphaproteobacteria bacterium]|nr:bifunctional acetate--CoA ligase family protein/GNAT family N-acetyltransferase [Alphaproteobacteria bacterium]
MSIRNLEFLFKPRSIALVGASNKPHSVGAVLARNLLRGGFAGPIMPVNPRETAIEGVLAYRDVASLPMVPDLAVVATPPDTVAAVIAELGRAGTRAAVVVTAGFGEGGSATGHARRQAMLDAAKPYLLRIVGPNCLGVAMPGAGVNATFGNVEPKHGRIAFVTQSGAMAVAVLDWAAPRGIGFSTMISIGDMADVDFGDLLDVLATDPTTQAILLYVEAVTNARKFMSAARAAARLKPVLVVKAGRHAEGAKAATSHTGALAGSDAVYDAAFRRAGMLRVGDMEELFDACATLSAMRQQRGDRLAILTNGGGPGVMATDALIAEGGHLAELAPATIERLDAVLPATWSHGNPVDIIGDADGTRYARALEAMLSDPNSDAVLIANCPTAITSPSEAADSVIAVAKGPLGGKLNILTSWLGDAAARPARDKLAAAQLAHYETPERAVRAFMHMVRYRRNQELLMETPPSALQDFAPDVARANEAIAASLADGREWLAPEEVNAVLSAYGIAAPQTRIARNSAEAGRFAAEIAAPVALKIRSPDITHKSDVGGVALNLRNSERVVQTAEDMIERVRATHPKARLDGFLVQEMVAWPGAIELIVGLVDDVIFGPVVLFGQGGIAVELLADKSLELPPLNLALAGAMMERTRVWRLLQGYRNQPPAAVEDVAQILVRVSQLAADHPEVKELDINPLLAHPRGAIALDARIRVKAAPQRGAERFAIRPYPREYEDTATLPAGETVKLRPIRPEDAPKLQTLVSRTDPEDVRMRFFAPLKGLPQSMAARLSQIDYEREMALVAEQGNGDGLLLGVARIAADPDRRSAEYAILVRSDWKGRGLGYLLLSRIVALAQERGIGAVYGDVLKENDAMLRMCRELGFRVDPHPDELTLVRVTKTLS